MAVPKLWVWMGSPSDKLDVLRYVSATEKDILNQPVVVKEIERLRSMIREDVKLCDEIAIELGCDSSWIDSLSTVRKLKSRIVELEELLVIKNVL